VKRIIILFIFYCAINSIFICHEISSAGDYQEKTGFNKNSSPSSELYIALGDSFAAGLGAKDYILSSGTCLRSKNAFSIDEEYGIAARFNLIAKFYACSGATTKTLVKSQINKHRNSLKKAKLVTVIIGGNNVNFSEVLAFCLFNSDCKNYFSNKMISLQKKIDAQFYKLATAFRTLKRAAPQAQIYVLGYPYLFNTKNNDSCEISKFIEIEEQKYLNDMTERLNHVIENAAFDAEVNFLSVTEAFSGHEICSEDAWINSFNTEENIFIELFHPNAKGQKAYAEIMQEAIKW